MSLDSFPRGVLVPAVTPFNADLSVDATRFVDHCRWLLAEGASGLAVFGTTSEANALSIGERTDLLERLIASGIPANVLLPGTGCCALPDTVALTRHAVQNGCFGVLMLPPFYYKGVSDDGLFASVAEVIERVADARLRIYLYHIPPMAGVGFSLPLIERLLKSYPSVVAGIKDSSGDWKCTKALLVFFLRPRFVGFGADERTDAAPGLEHTGALEIRIHPRDGVRIHPQVDGQLAHGWQLITRLKTPRGDGRSQSPFELGPDGRRIAGIEGHHRHLLAYTSSLVQVRQIRRAPVTFITRGPD